MKKSLLAASAILMLSAAITSCKKDLKTESIETLPATVSAQIQRLGFSIEGAKKVGNDYMVEGDILLSESSLSQTPTSPNMIVAQEEQYRTFNMVNTTNYPTIQIALNSSSSQHNPAFTAALDEVVKRYNAERLNITFSQVANNTSGTDITIVAYYQADNTLGSAGFPTSAGAPYNQVRMNTYHYSTGTDATNVNYIATIIAHEVGHCIGFRHTDYMSRRYSCGYGGNEGQASTGVGAVHIPGTPTKGDPNSWMLACIGNNVNRPFNTNDKVALSNVY